MDMGNTPKVLFKYLPPSRLNVLQDILIRFTQASSLNDTLELRPPIKGVAAHETLKGIARERLAPALWSETPEESRMALGRICPGLPELVGEILLQTAVQKGTRRIERRHEQNPHAVFDVTDRNFGILSLTEVPNDVRMWAHYADGGRGFLMEFVPEHPWFHGKLEERDSFRHLRQVRYVSSRASAYLLDTSETEFLYTKWSVWQDEKEWRIIRCFNDATKKCDQLDAYGNEILLFSIPPDSIKSIVLGFSANREFEMNVRAILSKNASLSRTNLKRAVQSCETGQVEITLDSAVPIV